MQRFAVWQMCLLACLVPTALLLGQETTGNGSVTGRVTDPSGASVPDATVQLIDESTNIPITLQTNSAGLYVFNDVAPGKYDLTVTKPGFRKSIVAGQEVVTGSNLTLNLSLEVGAANQVVEVREVLGAELQTEDATMGTALGGNAILQLPTIGRDVSALVFLQPTAAPTFNGAEGNITSGNIAGNYADQNTFMLDGGNNTSDLDGDNATYVGHNGSGVMPTPAESVEEFRVNTNNETADFSMSGGGQVMVATKRGTNTFHGSAYDFFQADWLNSNDWSNNYNGIPKPKAHFNRFGGALGGPLGPEFLGGKTYFYMNYEGQRYPRSGPFTALVPAATLRAGIIQERDASGNIVQYNLATSTACGPSGGMPCDPRGIGLNPVVSNIWNKYEPACNNFNYGDNGLNTCGYNGNLTFPLVNDFGVVRIDHDFGSKWRFFSSYRIYKNTNPTTDQVDVGGILPGDTLGKPAVASTDVQQPRSLIAGITGTLSPTLTNEFHFSYLRNQWQWLRAGALPEFGYPGAVEVGGENGPGAGLLPLNVNTQQARQRLWDGHDYEYRDNVSKLWGTHMFQAGGDFFREHWHFDRYDDVGLGLTSLVYDISSDNISFPAAYEPPTLAALGELGSWTSLYGQMAGLVGASSIVVTRTGSNLTANPLGTPVRSYVTDNTWSLYFNDTWKIKPNLTLAYGLNYQVQLPPTDANGVQDILTDASGNVITAESYLASRLSAANAGQAYNPTIGFTPIGDVKGLNYPYKPYYGEIAPRVSIAWSPQHTGGLLGWLLGDKATVIRAGYGRFYTRNLGIDLVSTPVLGDGFLEPVGCVAPLVNGTCTQASGSTPATAFRIGVDGVPPVGAITQTLPIPVEPNIPAGDPIVPYAPRTFTVDDNFKPGNSDSIDFSIQRQFKGNVILELGYVGNYARNLFQGIDINDVPWMTKLGGQTFANAYDNLYFQLHGGTSPNAVTPQPFFQAALPANSPYCKGYANCTVAVANQEEGNITGNYVFNLWSDLDTSFAFGPDLISTTQAGFVYNDTSIGYSNYNAGFASLQKRGQNLNMIANFTWSKALGLVAINQAYTEANINDPWNPGVDYGPQYYDRKFTFNLLGSYNLPFGKGQHWLSDNPILSRIVGGWIISPIFSYGSGLPLSVYTGSNQEFGEGETSDNGCNAVPLSSMGYSNSPVFGVNPTGIVGANGNEAMPGGTGVNLFGNPTAVFNNFRPALVGIDGRCGGAGILRGQQRWNLDLGLTKDTAITERVGIQFYAQAFNVFNHMMWGDPSLSLQSPASFGVLNSQYNAIGLGGNGATGEYTRIIQLGVRIRF